MLETLAKGFRSARQRLTGVAELSDDVIDEALREVRLSLLEADVEFRVVKRFLERVKEAARCARGRRSTASRPSRRSRPSSRSARKSSRR
jgi:signal recognition particle GTPase